jgi:hypothetical protein
LPRQFDIVENLNPIRRGRGPYPFLLILQHDRVSSMASIVVAPLVEVSAMRDVARLNPVVEVNGRRYSAVIAELAAIPRQSIGRVVGSAESHRYHIVAALDLLFTGI